MHVLYLQLTALCLPALCLRLSNWQGGGDAGSQGIFPQEPPLLTTVEKLLIAEGSTPCLHVHQRI